MSDEWDSDAKPALSAPISSSKTTKSKWEGEDDDDDEVASDWDDSSNDEEKPVPTPAAAPPKKKGTLKAKIAEKEAAKAARAGEEDILDEAAVLDPREKIRRDREREVEADMANATELLGTGESNGPKDSKLSELLSANPNTKEEFAGFASNIMEIIIKKHQAKPLYATFVENFVKDLAQPLKDVDVRKTASGLTALANEKQKEQRDKASGKKKPKASGKPTLGMTKLGTRLDTNIYEEALDDFGKDADDFM